MKVLVMTPEEHDLIAALTSHLPHLAALLVDEPKEFFEHAEMLVLGTDVANELEWQSVFAGEVVDLRRDLVVASAPMAAIQ